MLLQFPGSGMADGDVAADVVEAELMDELDVAPSFGDATVDAVLDAYLDVTPRPGRPKGVRLVPAQVADVADLGDATGDERGRRASRARMLDDLRSAAWADGTQLNYGSGLLAWREWCKVEGVPALPFSPAHVANFLIDYAFIWDGDDVALDTDGGPMPAVAATTVGGRLAALNRAALFMGLPRPGDNAGVQELMRGIRRRLGMAPEHRKAALDLSAVNACLTAATGLGFVSLRTRTAVLMRVRTVATAGQLARLGWADVTLGAEQVTIVLAATHRHGKPTTMTVPVHPNADLCLVRSLRDLRAMSVKLDRVFGHPRFTTPRSRVPGQRAPRRAGTAMTRQALHLTVDLAAAGAGGWDSLPHMPDRNLARLLLNACPTVPLAAARDRAVLLDGFWTAARRSNLSALQWRDVSDFGDDGISLIFRRSKTDQEGRGKTKWLPVAVPGSGAACPAQALRQYKLVLEAELGRPVLPGEPVFIALTGAGTAKVDESGALLRLTGGAINDVVQRLAVAAGLAKKPTKNERCPYGAHSLRAGFVTEALRGDKLSIAEVQDVTDHADVGVLLDYRREVNAPTSNPARKMLSMLPG